jgi:hypothetical protein
VAEVNAQITLNKRDRVMSLQALHDIMLGLSATAKGFALAPGEQTAAGEIIRLRKQDLLQMVQSSFTISEFAAEMTRQLQWLEKETGIKAKPQEAPTYNGVTFPSGTIEVKIEDDALVAVIQAESSLVPGQMVKKDIHIIRVGDKDSMGTETIMDDIKAVKAAWDEEHPVPAAG